MMWTIYKRPRDLPHLEYVARRCEILPNRIIHTPDVVCAGFLSELRGMFAEAGFTCIPRQPGDEPHIVEVWT